MNRWSKVFCAVPVLALSIGVSVAQIPPKREFRGAWIATVDNIDWPISSADGTGKQQSDFLVLLDSLQRLGINAVIFQVRPQSDAFYQSSIEPWSQWLTGIMGREPSPLYDPLQFAIDAAHSRGMELHAWFNPYRADHNVNADSIAPNHVLRTKPHLIRDYQSGSRGIKVLDPGEPETITYVTSVIMDVVRRYDIDGVHFDDYFYPYPVSALPFPDDSTYARYGDRYTPGSTLPLGDWRRENVNALIKMLKDSIEAVKPKVKFGISPFGIWRTIIGISPNTLKSYDDIYCDSRRWVMEGWVDYLLPQLYWNFAHSLAPYAPLAQWWSDNSFARHMYVGHATFNVLPERLNWPVAEIVNQISFNRGQQNIFGSVHFSAKYFRSNTKTVNDSLRATVYTNFTLDAIPKPFALLPTMAWKDNVLPNTPDSLKINPFSSTSTNALVTWKPSSAAEDGESAQKYILYKSRTLPINVNDVRNIAYITTQTGQIVPKPLSGGQVDYYAVSALDRLENESPLSNIMGITSTGTVGVEGEAPELPRKFVLHQNFPNPFNPVTIISFTLPYETNISLRVYDILGREVKVLAESEFDAGTHQLQFEGSGLPSGVYFYQLAAGRYVETKKMQLIK